MVKANLQHKLSPLGVRGLKIASSIVLALCAYAFWAIMMRAALSYQEQYQLFLTTSTYFREQLQWPGGMATYIGEALAQCYNNYWIGAAVVALMLVSVQRLTWRVSHRIAPKAESVAAYALSFVPAVLLWMYMGDLNVLPSFPVGLIGALVLALGFSHTFNRTSRLMYVLASVPLCYWLFGTSVYLLVVLMGIGISFNRTRLPLKIGYWVITPIYTISYIMMGAEWLRYPLAQQFIGINFYRLPLIMPFLQIAVWASVAVIVILCGLIMRKQVRSAAHGRGAAQGRGASSPYQLQGHDRLTGTIIWAAIAAFTVFVLYPLCFDRKIYELCEYDYLVRTNNWPAIISKAERSAPNSPMSVCALNLALGMTGQSSTRAFEFYQHGAEGLLPHFEKEANSSLMTAEALYQLGLINSAQRYTFEAMEALPNYRKSVRCIKRLAETNLIRGNYEVARKYLSLLSHTAFYKKWAKRTSALIDDPVALANHPVYGKLRSRQIDDMFLFSQEELDKIMGQLFLKDPTNSLAAQYLLLYPLLQKDLGKFIQYLQVEQQHGPVKSLIAQQALAMAYVKAGQDVPAGAVDPMVLNRFKEFARIWTSKGKDAPELEPYKNTVWYYLMKEN